MKPFIPEKLPIQNIDWEPLIPLIGRANRALAHYDGAIMGIPNSSILLSPLTTQEAVLSSRIEGTRATLGEVLEYEAGNEDIEDSKLLDIQEIINYRKALKVAEKELKNKPFRLNLLRELHKILLASVRGRNKGRGEFRTIQNWIGAPDSSIDEADFLPPKPEGLVKHLDRWEKFYHSGYPDPLVQLAIVHAQFEIIHPFLDGNGRLGRILVPLFLYEKEILSSPMFYLSAYLEKYRRHYIDSLRALNEPDHWNQWIKFFLKAIYIQAQDNTTKAREIMVLYDKMKTTILEITRSQYGVPMLDFMFAHPIFKSSQISFAKATPSKQLIAKMVRALKEARVLKIMKEGSGRQGQVYGFAELVNISEGKKVL